MPFNSKTAKEYGARGGREKGSKLSAKTKYEMLMDKVYLLQCAAGGTTDVKMIEMWLSKARELEARARALTVEEASETIRSGE
jgi:hypothetical protein